MSDQSIRRWIKAGELKAYKPKKEYRIAESDLQEFIEGRAVPLVQTPAPEQRSFDNHLRDSSRVRVKELAASYWRARERQDNADTRRRYLEEIKKTLNEAYEAVNARLQRLKAGGFTPAAWEEVREAERFYWSLIEMLRNAGFRIHEPKSGPPRVEEPEAA